MTQLVSSTLAKVYETAEDGTLYWTLSFYIEPKKVAAVMGRTAPVRPDLFRQCQRRHLPSRALRDAINPLFNDIADRETQGDVHEFLLAAEAGDGTAETADDTARDHDDLTFCLPETIEWQTEGSCFEANPPQLSEPRLVQLRRFWMSHNNGALSYHLSFSHRYGGEHGYTPATFYFLSCLQKLAAPKEYCLSLDPQADQDEEIWKDVFQPNLGIAPLDGITVARGDEVPERFWPFVRRQFDRDAGQLFERLAGGADRPPRSSETYADRLMELVPFIEVPGLKVPKSRFMFVFHDKRFFGRLMPVHPQTGETVARKLMVRPECYLPYQRELARLKKVAGRGSARRVCLGPPYWQWVTDRPDVDPSEPSALASEPCRTDCLDYLFLAGFNQNIIDFMNQDTSEILDSTDPLYPAEGADADECFFVRYANHRAMITYVRSSRSLEIGNDYIGTCPYAFLIHVLALHNEFLGRAHEMANLASIRAIENHIENRLFDQAEQMINEIKLDEFRAFERYRYANPFRYDTEREVFEKLEDLRGVSRKKNAIAAAVRNLEDHAADLQRRQEKSRDIRLNVLLGGLGVFGAGQMIYWIGEKAIGNAAGDDPRPVMFLRKGDGVLGDWILSLTELVIAVFTVIFVIYLLIELVRSDRVKRLHSRLTARLSGQIHSGRVDPDAKRDP